MKLFSIWQRPEGSRPSRRSVIALSSLLLASLALAGCPAENQTATGGEGTTGTKPPDTASTPASSGNPAAGGKQLKLAFVTNNSSDFWTIARKGTEKADGELANATVEFKMPSEGTAADQRRVVDDLMAAGVDGIAISPNDPVNQTAYLNEIAAKVPVLTQDSDAPNSNRLCYIGTDNVAAGKMAGEEIKAALPNGGKIVLFVGKKDAQNAKERIQGIEEALKGTKIQILDTRTDDTDHAKAKSNVADALVKDPDVAGMVGIWSYNGPAILNAVKEAGKVGKVKIIAFDEEDETLAGVKDGSISATIVQQPYEFGYQSMLMLAKIAGGDKSAIPADKKQIVPTKAIKQADVDEFKKKLDELRGRTK